ncbi:hypothetical protein T484DRAFT_1823495 [Baffinella frigidus]|nr:hypothetical protein T484DRAFT_1823495 [Cryptophyta sp. CCMP2293]
MSPSNLSTYAKDEFPGDEDVVNKLLRSHDKKFVENESSHIAFVNGVEDDFPRDEDAPRCVHLAAAGGHREALDALQLLDDFPRDEDAPRCVHLAAAGGHREALDALQLLGADLDRRCSLTRREPLKSRFATRWREVLVFDREKWPLPIEEPLGVETAIARADWVRVVRALVEARGRVVGEGGGGGGGVSVASLLGEGELGLGVEGSVQTQAGEPVDYGI